MKKILVVAPFAMSLLVLASQGHKSLDFNAYLDTEKDYEDIYDLAKPCNCASCMAIREIANEFENHKLDKIDDKYLKEMKLR